MNAINKDDPEQREKHETLGIPPPKVSGVASKDWF